jgi:hypothetical protein
MKLALVVALTTALASCSFQVRQQTPLQIGIASPVPTQAPTLSVPVHDVQWESLVVQGWRVYIRECANTSCAPIQPLGVLQGGTVIWANCSYNNGWCMVDQPRGWVWAPCLGKDGVCQEAGK